MSKKNRFLLGSSAALLGFLAMPVQATEQVKEDSASASDENVIIVTAQRREQALIDVPIAVSAVGNAALQRAQVFTVSDIATVTAPIDVVYGALDQFMSAGTMRIIEQMRHVTMHRVEVNDHLVRARLAKAVAKVIG